MRISYKTDYSLKIILYLSGSYPDDRVQIKKIAEELDIPRKFLEQILLMLKSGGFLLSKKGPKGGYFLARPPRDISLGAVIRFVNGPIHPISGIEPGQESSCDFTAKCVFRNVWQDVEAAIAGVIDTLSFEDLVEKQAYLLGNWSYDYQI